jgi:hypothetical protein
MGCTVGAAYAFEVYVLTSGIAIAITEAIATTAPTTIRPIDIPRPGPGCPDRVCGGVGMGSDALIGP